ncbi:MAG: hypothetical protein ACT6QT_06815 [Sphingopyxis sp.]|jgi:hypothetical protein|uniref:hypothetical protein n=1 Tax=Alphaproteobacteria TaxID=28211 RepID=UPI003F7246AE
MTYHNYLISYDAFSSVQFEAKLLGFVKENGKIAAWSRPYLGLYLVKSDQDLLSVRESFFSFFGDQTAFVVCPISKFTLLGILPAETWNWLSKDTENELIQWSESY